MPTVAQILNRRQDPPPERHYTATIKALETTGVYRLALDPGGAETAGTPTDNKTYTQGQRVLLLVTTSGNFILGTI